MKSRKKTITLQGAEKEKLFIDNLRSAESGTYYTMDDIETFINVSRIRDVKQIKRRNYEYVYDCPASFDIETSSFYNDQGEKRAIMYIWMFGLNGAVLIGRTWEEFENLCLILQNVLQLTPGVRHLNVYVHNLGFEFGFMENRFDWFNLFAISERRPIYCTNQYGICFKCSLLLSGYSLAMVGNNLLKYKVKKLTGDLDYSLIRTKDTVLSPAEMQYCINDVLVVMAYIMEKIENDGDITKIRNTKTGYVRKLCQQNCLYAGGNHNYKYNKDVGRQYERYHGLMSALPLSPEEYAQAKRAFAGGFTHASAFGARKVYHRVESRDLSSSYPTVLCAELFPMSRAEEYVIKDKRDFLRQNALYCTIFDVEFYGLDSLIYYDNYISRSKCWKISGEVVNNGRVVSADYLCTTITNVDYDIIRRVYKCDKMVIHNFRRYKRGYLPHDFVKTILTLYGEKTTLKGITSEDGTIERRYLNSKEQLNSMYGMCVTDIARPDLSFSRGEWVTSDVDIKEAIDKYNNSRSRTTSYLWGIFCTAYARHNLWDAIYSSDPECLKDDYLYSDTDSVKFINPEKHQGFFDRYNQAIVDKLDRAMDYHGFDRELTRPKNKKGDKKQMGIYEYECTYDTFKTLGAKRYLTETDGELHITVAGLAKQNAVDFLEYKIGDHEKIFEFFDDEMEIPAEYDKAGKTLSGTGKNTHTYADFEITGKITDYQGHLTEYYEKSFVHLEACKYDMSIAADYINFIKDIQDELYIN